MKIYHLMLNQHWIKTSYNYNYYISNYNFKTKQIFVCIVFNRECCKVRQTCGVFETDRNII